MSRHSSSVASRWADPGPLVLAALTLTLGLLFLILMLNRRMTPALPEPPSPRLNERNAQ